MRIGIVAQDTGEIVGVHQDYLNLAEEFGTPIIISPIDKADFFSAYKIDGLILPGGADVNPKRYGAWFSFKSGRPNLFLEYFDTEILPSYLNIVNFPIFGICRGLQTLNVVFGGTLIQHLKKHPVSQNKKDFVHKVTTKSGKIFGVNSFHHQAIGKLSSQLVSLATSDDGFVEAVHHVSKPISAVQWHPERMFDEFSLDIMDALFS